MSECSTKHLKKNTITSWKSNVWTTLSSQEIKKQNYKITVVITTVKTTVFEQLEQNYTIINGIKMFINKGNREIICICIVSYFSLCMPQYTWKTQPPIHRPPWNPKPKPYYSDDPGEGAGTTGIIVIAIIVFVIVVVLIACVKIICMRTRRNQGHVLNSIPTSQRQIQVISTVRDAPYSANNNIEATVYGDSPPSYDEVLTRQSDAPYSAYNDVIVDMETSPYDVNQPPSYEDVCSDVTQNPSDCSISEERPPKYEDVA